MYKLMTWLKSIQLDRIVTAFLVGILLFVSTACSKGVEAKTADQIREEVPSSAVTNKFKGGMNDYSDVDPRKNTTEASTKAKALVDNAKRNTSEKIVDSPQQLGDRVKRVGNKVGDAVENVKENTSNAVGDLKENVSKGTQKNIRQTQGLVGDAKDKAIQTKENSKDALKDTAKGVKRAADNVSETSDNLGSKIKRGAQDAADAVKSTVNKATDAID